MRIYHTFVVGTGKNIFLLKLIHIPSLLSGEVIPVSNHSYSVPAVFGKPPSAVSRGGFGEKQAGNVKGVAHRE